MIASEKRNPLHDDSVLSEPECLAQALACGADANEPVGGAETPGAYHGLTPLHLAAERGYGQAVTALIQAGARIDIKAGKLDQTPLAIACQSTTVSDVVQRLLAAGADPGARDSGKRTALHWICIHENRYRDFELILASLAAAGGGVEPSDIAGRTPLHYAITPEMTLALLSQGGYIDREDKAGDTPLLMKIEEESQEAACTLIDAGADVEYSSKDGATPLFLADEKGQVKIVKHLINAGVDVHAQDTTDNPAMSLNTALHWAAYGGWPDVVEPLVTAGADLDRVNRAGDTPEDIAARFGNEAFIECIHAIRLHGHLQGEPHSAPASTPSSL